MARIIVCGYMIRYPVAGMQMAYLHYILGLKRLGHEVVYLEESGWPDACYDPVTQEHGEDPHVGLQSVRSLMDHLGVSVPVVYVHRDTGPVAGMDWTELKDVLDSADLLLNVGGVCWLPEFRRCSRRALVDMDPLFTQVRRFGVEGFDEYHSYFTYGANVGQPQCDIPTVGKDWHPTVPPVVSDLWPTTCPDRPDGTSTGRFTTIANWQAYGGITYEGRHYGQKGEEFLRLLNLPGRVSASMELALANADPDDQRRLSTAGWVLSDGETVSTKLSTYQHFITCSRGEFSAAKNAYVSTRSGWFSDRSVCYLAAGRPVVLQDTGFTDWLPTGDGVLAFSSENEAAHCIDRVNADYPRHRRAARRIAKQTFGYGTVLPRLLEVALHSPSASSVSPNQPASS